MRNLNDVLTGLRDGVQILESAVELNAQTGRFKNLLSSADLGNIMGNTVAALRKLNGELKAHLEEE